MGVREAASPEANEGWWLGGFMDFGRYRGKVPEGRREGG